MRGVSPKGQSVTAQVAALKGIGLLSHQARR